MLAYMGDGLACNMLLCLSFDSNTCNICIVDSVAITLVMSSTRVIKCKEPSGQEAHPETQSKELRLGALLLEGTHALHGIGHHGHSSWSHLPAASGIY